MIRLAEWLRLKAMLGAWLVLGVVGPALGQDTLPASPTAAYTGCLTGYVRERIDWQATPADLADAALSACGKERERLRQAILAQPARSQADAAALIDGLEVAMRRMLIRVVIEARNDPFFKIAPSK